MNVIAYDAALAASEAAHHACWVLDEPVTRAGHPARRVLASTRHPHS